MSWCGCVAALRESVDGFSRSTKHLFDLTGERTFDMVAKYRTHVRPREDEMPAPGDPGNVDGTETEFVTGTTYGRSSRDTSTRRRPAYASGRHPHSRKRRRRSTVSRRQPSVPLRTLVIISFVALAVLLLASAGFATGGDLPPLSEVAQDRSGDPEPVAIEYPSSVEYKVRGGDTLWSIAAAHTPSEGDVRATVADLRDHNALRDSLIHPGQILHLPPAAG
jgi:LysM repeat protein